MLFVFYGVCVIPFELHLYLYIYMVLYLILFKKNHDLFIIIFTLMKSSCVCSITAHIIHTYTSEI